MAQDQTGQRSRQGGESFAAVYHTPTRIWICVVCIILGVALGAVAFIVKSLVLFIIAAVVALVAAGAALAFGIMENVH